MKTLYLDCAMGAAGDMLMGALLELCPEKESFLETMNGLLPGVSVTAERKASGGIMGTHMHVLVHGQEEGHAHHEHEHEHEHTHAHEHEHDHSHAHHHAHPADIAHQIGHLPLPEGVKAHALAVYDSIAQAEARAHGKPVTEIHFHEVGTLDAVADVVGVCLLMDMLGVERVAGSPVHVGAGHVHCAHGVLPVPAPATAYLLEGVPCYGGEVQGELCTPTGAALLRHFVSDFGPMPRMTLERTGYGVGAKAFSRPNLLRAMLGEAPEREETPHMEDIAELSCNIDDMTAEELAYGAQVLREAGALEVYTTAAGMKKDRPGVVLTCICRRADRRDLAALMFRHLSTLGVRETLSRRYVLDRTLETRQTELGPVRVKVSSGFGVEKEKPEFEDLKALARENDMTLREVKGLLL